LSAQLKRKKENIASSSWRRLLRSWPATASVEEASFLAGRPTSSCSLHAGRPIDGRPPGSARTSSSPPTRPMGGPAPTLTRRPERRSRRGAAETRRAERRRKSLTSREAAQDTTRKTAIGSSATRSAFKNGALRVFTRSAPCTMRHDYINYPQRTTSNRALPVFIGLKC
jgi:hypothetical protein